MENFIYSINVTVPIFLLILLGWFLKQKGMLTEAFVTSCNKLNFKVTLPFLLFQDISGVDIRAVFDLKYVLFCAIVTSICFWGIWGCAKLLVRQDEMRGAFVQASFRGSAAVLGLAFIQNIYGQSAMGPLMIIGAVPLYNIYAVIVLTFEGMNVDGKKDTGKIKKAVSNILKNPIIIAIFLGLAVSLCNISFPVMINKTIGSVAQLATPLTLIAMGAGFEGRKALAKMKPALAAAGIKLIIQPLLFLPLAWKLGFDGEKMIAIMVMLAAPSTPSCYIMAKNMNNDGILTASIIVVTMMLAAFTLTGWIYIMKSLGIIG